MALILMDERLNRLLRALRVCWHSSGGKLSDRVKFAVPSESMCEPIERKKIHNKEISHVDNFLTLVKS